jgi:ABC-type bacteriocin/lantibiotic exporter with double-glycine peptidase domain
VTDKKAGIKVEIQEASFAYDNSSRNVINAYSASIEAGSLTSITGRSGVGKSTLGKLLIGLEELKSGSILLDGQDPRTHVAQYPGSVSYVPQEIHLINGTIAENIALGEDTIDIDVDRVKQSLVNAQAVELVDLPDGILTSLRKINLSGGQKQRLGIARALYTNPRFILLDEPTSALDPKTEEALVDTLNSLRGKITLVVIAHRQTTIDMADVVLNLGH